MDLQNAFSILAIASTDKEGSEDGDEERVSRASWTVANVKSAEIVYGIDMWPVRLLPPIPDVPCYSCRARTHLQGTCPLLLCGKCHLYGHQERYCQKASFRDL